MARSGTDLDSDYTKVSEKLGLVIKEIPKISPTLLDKEKPQLAAFEGAFIKLNKQCTDAERKVSAKDLWETAKTEIETFYRIYKVNHPDDTSLANLAGIFSGSFEDLTKVATASSALFRPPVESPEEATLRLRIEEVKKILADVDMVIKSENQHLKEKGKVSKNSYMDLLRERELNVKNESPEVNTLILESLILAYISKAELFLGERKPAKPGDAYKHITQLLPTDFTNPKSETRGADVLELVKSLYVVLNDIPSIKKKISKGREEWLEKLIAIPDRVNTCFSEAIKHINAHEGGKFEPYEQTGFGKVSRALWSSKVSITYLFSYHQKTEPFLASLKEQFERVVNPAEFKNERPSQ